MDDDDEFLYGASKGDPGPTVAAPQTALPNDTEPKDYIESLDKPVDMERESNSGSRYQDPGSEDESGSDDVEFIMEPAARSLDFRQAAARTFNRPPSTPKISQPQPTLTTEYTPRERGAPVPPKTAPPLPAAQTTTLAPSPLQLSATGVSGETVGLDAKEPYDSVDPSTLPPAIAPPSHPSINPSLPATLDGRSIFEVDLSAMTEKPWRRPGSDISDWFNYGFDEISWEAYCYRRRDLGEMANVLKTNVLNFAGMPEDQLNALPIEIRQMVMTGATAMMAGASANPAMMAGAVGMNPMMDMSGMGAMNMGAMGMGMNGDMGMQMQGAGPMMQEGQVQGAGGQTPEQTVQMGMGDGFVPGGPGSGMMGMGMGGDFGMQDPSAMGQVMYPGMDSGVAPVPTGRGGTPPIYGRGRPPAPGLRGRAVGYPPRGRGRGVMYPGADSERPAIPVRPASPLPPGVPTGPRNQNKYKDRDGNAPAVEGLDYGGGNTMRGESGESDDRGARKRRNSPGPDDGRGPKRR